MAFASIAGGPIPIDPYSLSPPIMKNHVIKSFMYDSTSSLCRLASKKIVSAASSDAHQRVHFKCHTFIHMAASGCQKGPCVHLARKHRAAVTDSICSWLLMLYRTPPGALCLGNQCSISSHPLLQSACKLQNG